MNENKITEETIQKIEQIFGFPLHDWHKDYIMGKSEYVATGRCNGKTFAYCIKLLLSDGEPIPKRDLFRYMDMSPNTSYPFWFKGFCLDINEKLVNAGFETRIEV